MRLRLVLVQGKPQAGFASASLGGTGLVTCSALNEIELQSLKYGLQQQAFAV